MARDYVPVERPEVDSEITDVSDYEERPPEQLSDDEITDREEGFLRGYEEERQRRWGESPDEEFPEVEEGAA